MRDTTKSAMKRVAEEDKLINGKTNCTFWQRILQGPLKVKSNVDDDKTWDIL